MRTLIHLCVKHNRASLFVLVLVTLAGMSSYRSIPKESNPDIKIPIIFVHTHCPGISPEDAVGLLIKPLEHQFKTITNIKTITSVAKEGGAYITLKFIAGGDSKAALQDVRAAVENGVSELPSDAERPKVQEINLSLEPVLRVVLSSSMPKITMLKFAKNIRSRLEDISSVLRVDIKGGQEEVLEIIIKPEVMASYGLNLQDIKRAINSNKNLVASGLLREQSGEYSIKVPGTVTDYSQFLDFPVKEYQGKLVLLRDVALVNQSLRESDTVSQVNGEPALVLEVVKRTGSNIITTIAEVKKEVNDMLAQLPKQLKVRFTHDDSRDITDMINDLENNIIIASFLVIALVILSMGTASAFLVTLSIPVSFFAGILMLDVFGFTLNVVVLFSLILTVGMIVDDAIVVSEYADRKIRAGTDPSQAYLKAADHMLWPIVTSTLVKILVFIPLLFWPGVTGEFMKFMPITVVLILSSSLLFALFIQPSLGPLLGRKNVPKDSYDEDMVHYGYTSVYANLLQRALARPKQIAWGVLTCCVMIYMIFALGGAGVEFFPSVEPEEAEIVVQAAGDLSLTQKTQLLQRCEEKLAPLAAEVKLFYTQSGMIGRMNLPEDAIGSIIMEFTNWKHRRKAKKIISDARALLLNIPGIKYQVYTQSSGPNSGNPIAVDVASENSKQLNIFADKLLEYARKDLGLVDLQDNRSTSATEWRVIIDRAKASYYQLNVDWVGSGISFLTSGAKIGSYRPTAHNDEVDIVLRFPPQYRNLAQLQHFNVINPSGRSIPITNFARVVAAPKSGNINRVDGVTTVSISAIPKAGHSTSSAIASLRQWVDQNHSDDVKVIFKGEADSREESQNFLVNAFGIAILGMFLVMLIQFNNFYHTIVVMSAVFVSTTGVLLGLMIFRQQFSVVMSGIGVIALSGIVLNNNIIFIDTYHRLRLSGVPLQQALILSGTQRLRPIFLTATTAVLGMLPMVFGLTFDFYQRTVTYDAPSSQMWRPLAFAISSGLTFATILTLFFTPCLLLLGKRWDIQNKP